MAALHFCTAIRNSHQCGSIGCKNLVVETPGDTEKKTGFYSEKVKVHARFWRFATSLCAKYNVKK